MSRKAARKRKAPGYEDRKFACDICQDKFERSHDRQRHYDHVHLQVKSVCPFCSGRFSTKSSLKRHIGSQHKVEWSLSRSVPADTSTDVAPAGSSTSLKVVEVPEPEIATVRQVRAEEAVSSEMREVIATSNSVAVRLLENENPDDIPELISCDAMTDFEPCLPPELYGPIKGLPESLADHAFL